MRHSNYAIRQQQEQQQQQQQQKHEHQLHLQQLPRSPVPQPQQQQQQQQQPNKPEGGGTSNRVLSDSTLVVIVCAIFASLVGAVFIICLLRAVCRDLPGRLRAWRRGRRSDRRDSGGGDKLPVAAVSLSSRSSTGVNHHHYHGNGRGNGHRRTENGEDVYFDGDIAAGDDYAENAAALAAAAASAAAAAAAATAASGGGDIKAIGEPVGFLLMHTRQESIEVLDTVGFSRGHGGGGGGGSSASANSFGCHRSQEGGEGGAVTKGPGGRLIEREYFV